MADQYISDSVFAQYVEEHGSDAKEVIREVVADAAPAPEYGGDGDE